MKRDCERRRPLGTAGVSNRTVRARARIGAGLIALAAAWGLGLGACSRETFTGVDVELQVGTAMPINQVRLTTVVVGTRTLTLADSERLFPRMPGRDLHTGDSFTLQFADSEATKPVQISAIGLMNGAERPPVVTTTQVVLQKGTVISLSLVLGTPGGDGGGTGGGSPGTGGDGAGTGGATGSGGDGAGTGGGGPGTGGAGAGSGGAVGTGGGGAGGRGTGGAGAGSGGAVGTGGGGGRVGSGGTVGSGGAVGTGGRVGSGGAATGGAGTGGAATGGRPGTGGAGTGGAAPPPGYWTSGPWHGCPYTVIDTVAGTTTTITPRDFVSKPAANPYCVSGRVHAAYEGLAALAFNLNQPQTVSSCAASPTPPAAPGVALTGAGLAVGFAKRVGSVLRVELVGPSGLPADRWCSNVASVAGPLFIPWSSFRTNCWDTSGTAYGNQSIASIWFDVPGTTASATSYDFCVSGLVPGSSAADAPPNPTVQPLAGMLTGDFDRVKVTAGGKSYIVYNNNWSAPGGSDQTIAYTGNSFRVVSSTGMSAGGAPVSSPAVYIGANGDTMGGVYSTRSDDNLPRTASAIQSINATYRYNAGTATDYDASISIWLSASQPAAQYNDAASGSVDVWLYKPPSRSPLGTMTGSITIGGRNFTIWVGQRAPGVPAVTYVSQSTIASVTLDLKPFLTGAVMNGIPASWYVTDIFGGFEIFTGSSSVGLELLEFTAVVQ
jgi:hypothetical protein